MNKTSFRIWGSCIGLCLVHQILQKDLDWECYFLDSFLDSFLSMPILLGGLQLERTFVLRKVNSINKTQTYQFSLLEIGVLGIFFSLLFEEGFPYWTAHFTKDYWDYLMYFLGTCFFYFFMNKTQNITVGTSRSII